MDRISRFPDEILLNILTFLPTKHAVATSILSHRWSSLWTSLPVIDLDTHEDEFGTPLLVKFVDNFLTVNNSPRILEFRLKAQYFDRNYLSSINRWIQFLFSRNVVEFDLQIIFFGDVFKHKACLRLSPCESLEVLKLDSNFGLDMPISACCFPNLRILHLSVLDNWLYQELVAKLFPNLPVLEELCLTVTSSPWELFQEKRFDIVAPALKSFSMSIHSFSVHHSMTVKIDIDAPLLEKICLKDDFISFYSFNNRPCLLEAQVSVGDRMGVKYFENGYFHARVNIARSMELLWGVSNSKSLSLSGNAVLALVYSPRINLPAFPFLTKLELFISYVSAWKMLLPLLANAPNLRVLVITMRECVVNTSYHLEEESMLAYLIEDFQFCPPGILPTCMLSHLEEIEIRGVEKKEEVKELEYIVENAKVLKKLTVNSVGSSEWCPKKRASA